MAAEVCVLPFSSPTKLCLVRIWSRELRATESNGWNRPFMRTGSLPNSREWKSVSGFLMQTGQEPARHHHDQNEGIHFFMIMSSPFWDSPASRPARLIATDCATLPPDGGAKSRLGHPAFQKGDQVAEELDEQSGGDQHARKDRA